MPSVGMGGSTIANLTAQRAKLSAVRSKLGMEGGQPAGIPQGGMRAVAPTNAPPPAAVVGPQAQAAMGPQGVAPTAGPPGQAPTPEMQPGLSLQPGAEQATIQPPQEGQNIQFQHRPEAQSQMLNMVTNFINQHGPQQQALIDQQRSQQQPQTQEVGGGGRLSPIADFYKQMGRLPTPQELLMMGAQNHLTNTKGRPPTQEELTNFVSQGPQQGGGQ